MSVAYVICAAGEGSRFRKDFGNLPKSLIKLCGHTLLEWSLRSLPVFSDDKLILITQKKHRLKEKCLEMVKNLYPFNYIKWIEIPTLTRGQLETASLARPYVKDEDSLVIYNCDTYFQSKTLEHLINEIENPTSKVNIYKPTQYNRYLTREGNQKAKYQEQKEEKEGLIEIL